MTRRQCLQMKGGVQLPMFALEAEPEPATMAGPARPALADNPQPPMDDRSTEQEVDR